MNTSALKIFAQQTRSKLVDDIRTHISLVLNTDSAELRGKKDKIDILKKEIAEKGEQEVIEEVAYTWFNRVMALRFMDANGYNTPMVVTPAPGQIRPEILQEAMGGSVDEELHLSAEDLQLSEDKLYQKLLLAVCNQNYQTMPFLFEAISDYTELLLPSDLLSEQSFVTDICKGMSDEDCQNVEIMGWLYQFYITDRKADAETKKSKKGGLKSDEQAAATQLFTPHWIVRYMVENTLGRIWTALHPDTSLRNEMPYYIEPADGQADPIPEDIQSVKDIRFIDPCMGSGHVLVYAFDLLCKMYEEEGYRSKEIPALIFENNLYGMDIDKRCYQLASFALTMKARAYYSRYLRKDPIAPKVLYLQKIEHNTIEECGNWDKDSLVWQFENIDTIGSLLKITHEECDAIQVGTGFWAEEQKKMKIEAEFLSRGYHCVVTNPPYLGKGFCDELKSYVQKEHPNSKADTMATFMERCMEYCVPKGKMAMINMQSWMFLSSFEKLRKDIIEHYQIDSLLHLGAHTFDEISGEVVQNAAFTFIKTKDEQKGIYFDLTKGSTCSAKEALFKKKEGCYRNVNQNKYISLPGANISYWINEKLINTFRTNNKLIEIAETKLGMSTNDNGRFLREWFEIGFTNMFKNRKNQDNRVFEQKWFPYSKGGSTRKWFGNLLEVINWYNNGFEVKKLASDLYGSYTRTCKNSQHFFKSAITWNLIMSGMPCFRYLPEGCVLGDAGPVCFGAEKSKYLLGLLNSKLISFFLPIINPTLNCSTGVINCIPVNYTKNENIDSIVQQNIFISKSDWDAHETSWDFTSNELLSINSEEAYKNIMHDYADFKQICIDLAPAELPSLSWRVDVYKTKWETQFMRLHQNEETLNEMFIQIYGLEDELTPDVPLNEVTILQQGEISIEDGKLVWHDDVIIKQFISYLVGCFMGRYSVDKPGLIIANQHQDLSSLGLQVDGLPDSPQSTLSIDDDGIVPIILEPDFFADDLTERIQLAIKCLFGEAAYFDNMKYIERTIGKSLREYLYKDYYADHQQMYSVKGAKRPIYWLFSSRMGDKHKKGYFKALVYMHRMEADTLSKLHADYVHPYINKVEQQLREADAETLRNDLTQAQRNKALKLANELKEKVREVKEFEQELVEMASHRLTIDLDDGVKANYPKYYPLVEPIKGLEV